jgi:hypothetical protein
VGAHGDKDRPIQEGGRWLHPGDILTLAALAPETEPGPVTAPARRRRSPARGRRSGCSAGRWPCCAKRPWRMIARLGAPSIAAWVAQPFRLPLSPAKRRLWRVPQTSINAILRASIRSGCL